MESDIDLNDPVCSIIMDSSPDAIVAFDKDMRYIVFNSNAEHVSGLTRKDVLGKKFADVQPDFRGMPIDDCYQDALKGKSTKLRSVSYINSQTGAESYFDAFYTPLKDKNAEIVGIAVRFREVTRRLEAEKNLESQEKKFRLLAEHATDVVYLSDPQGRYTYVSPSLKRVTGYEPDEIIGHHILEHVHPEDIDGLLKYRKAQKKSQVVPPFVYRRRPKNGSYRWMESTSQAIHDADTGELIEIQSTVRDIHDRILLEEQLRESERKFRLLAAHSTDIIYRTDRKGIILYASPSLEKITGFSPAEVVGHSFFEYIHPEDLQNVWTEREKQIELDAIFTLTYRRITKEGKYLWLESTSKGIRDEETGEVTEFQTSIRDVSHRVELEIKLKENNQQLQRTIDELGQLVFVISHDLSEPLHSISVFSKMFIESCSKDDRKVQTFSAQINESTSRMSAMLRDLRSYQAAIQSKDQFGEVDLKKVLDRVKEQLKTQIKETSAQIIVAPMPIAYGSESQLVILFECLIDNSLKFRRQDIHPRIEIRAKKNGEEWQFDVKDNGIGIKQEYESKVFTIFEQLHPRNSYAGTGIGLAIAKKIIQNHGGEIWLRSKEGVGSTFFFTLPAKP